MSKTEAKHINVPRSLQRKATSISCEVWDVCLHPCLGNWVAIGRPVVFHAQTAHAFSAGIKCRYCIEAWLGSAFGKLQVTSDLG